MSTRSVVAIPRGTGWIGTYVHFDGYPQHMMPALTAMIERDGIDTVIDTLIIPGGWSLLNPNANGSPEPLGAERARGVVGYGVAYNDGMAPTFFTSDDDLRMIEYVYLLDANTNSVRGVTA